MKAKFIFGLLGVFLISVSAVRAQQTFTLNTIEARGAAPGNIKGFSAEIDHPALNNNPNAIVIADPLTAGYPHPVAVWYRQNKWHVTNINQQSMTARIQFQIRYWTAPNENQFVHKVTADNLLSGAQASRIDHPALNSRPAASWSVYQSISNERNDSLTANIARGEYNEAEKKWFLVNESSKPFSIGNSYNIIVFSSGAAVALDKSGIPENAAKASLVNPPASSSPTGNAGGDLSGAYPNPNVVGLSGRPLSSIQPKVGDVLKWDGAQWKPVSEEQTMITAITQNPNASQNPPSSGKATEPLKFNPTLGRKIILYPGQTGDVGLSVQGNLLQIHSDNPNADVAVGYDQSGTFNEKLRVKASGAIAVSGDAGQPGQVLTSSGAGSAPTWKQPTGGADISAGIKTYFKNLPQPQSRQWVGGSENLNLTALNYSVTLEKKSRLRITGKIKVEKDVCALCNDPIGYFSLYIDGVVKPESTVFLDTNTGSSVFKSKTFTIADYMIELEPGTHTIEFWVRHVESTTRFSVVPHYSTLMVIPVQ